MSAGFPEDNPWGDRQLAVSVAGLQEFLRDGLALANAPGIAYEYSNLGYALLGQVIWRVSGQPYQQYITREILLPLGMKDTLWEYAEVPPAKLALGYRRATGAGWEREPLLADGVYGAMGGLLTTLPDFARYAALHLAAWPARDDPDAGIARRATLREMHQPAVFSSFNAGAKSLAGDPLPLVNAYGYGLTWTNDSRGVVRVGHSGGLPGFGSNWRFYPDHGVAVVSCANLTYAGTGAVNAKVGALLIEQGALPRRSLPPSALLETRQRQLATLVQTWEPTLADAIVAENFFLDRSRDAWRQQARAALDRIGAIRSVGELTPENQLRGTFPIVGEKGRIDVFFTLTPEKNPRVQELSLTVVASP
jgi:CubicO group peptidase (beta-lactamase class C family)